LSALAMWPKGDAWGGGGLFEGETRLLLNHPPGQNALGEGFHIPNGFSVLPLGETSGRGEDRPLQQARDDRDGWRLVRSATWHKQRRRSRMRWVAQGGEIHKKDGGDNGGGIALYRTLEGVDEVNGPFYVLRHTLVREATGESAELGRTDWA